MKIFSNNIRLLKVDRFEGFSNQSKTDGIVNNYLSSCNSHQISFELQQYVASQYRKNSIKMTTFASLNFLKQEMKCQPKHPGVKK